jgi:hypothetical protein
VPVHKRGISALDGTGGLVHAGNLARSYPW